MSFSTMISSLRLVYHANLVDFGNGFNQLGLLSDEKAEEFCKKHTIAALEAAARRRGMSLEKALEEIEKRNKN